MEDNLVLALPGLAWPLLFNAILFYFMFFSSVLT